MSEDDYIKRMPLSTFSAQNRGGKGIIGTDLKENDSVSSVFVANSHDYLLCFTNQGQIYTLRGFQIPEMSRTARGKSAVNLLDLDSGEELTAVVNMDDIEAEEIDGQRYLTMVTRDGYIKRTSVDEFQNIRKTGIRAVRLEDGDQLVDVEVTDGDRTLVVATADGMTIRFDEEDVRAMGRSARGVRGVDLQGDDTVAGVAGVDTDRHSWVLTVTKNGYGKRSDIEEYRVQSRNGKGLIDIKTNSRNGQVCAMETVGPGDHLIVMSTSGQIMRTPVEGISIVGRNTMGVIVMELEGGDRVACLDVIPREMVTDASESEVDLSESADDDEAN